MVRAASWRQAGHHGVGGGGSSGGSRLCQGSRTCHSCGGFLGGHVFVAVIGSSGVVDGIVEGVIDSIVFLVVLFAVSNFLF